MRRDGGRDKPCAAKLTLKLTKDAFASKPGIEPVAGATSVIGPETGSGSGGRTCRAVSGIRALLAPPGRTERTAQRKQFAAGRIGWEWRAMRRKRRIAAA